MHKHTLPGPQLLSAAAAAATRLTDLLFGAESSGLALAPWVPRAATSGSMQTLRGTGSKPKSVLRARKSGT